MRGIYLVRAIPLLLCVHGIIGRGRKLLNGRGFHDVPIDEIPTDVTVLELQNNRLTQLSDHIFENHSLIRELNLWKNRITELSEECFFGITDLTKLNLGRNKLMFLPDLSLLSNTLKHLNLQENNIIATAFTGISLNKLEFLTLEANNLYQLMTDHMYRMPNISTFNLNDNGITTIEGGFFWESTNLKILDLSGNELTDFNPYGFGLSNSTIKIYLEYNEISVLQDGSFVHLIHLETLQLDYNNLITFDVEMLTDGQGLPNLKNLHLVGNKIGIMPSNSLLSSNLTTFDTGQNNISGVSSDHFRNLSRLATLKLDSNSLTEMPKFYATLASLEVMTLSNNKIHTCDFSMEYASKIPKIVELDVSFNKLSYIEGQPDIILNKLEILDLSNNIITGIPDEFFAMTPKLKVLNLKHNRLSQLRICNNMSFIETIDLKANMLTVFPEFSIEILQNVNSLYLSINRIATPIRMTSIYRTENPDFNAASLKFLCLSGNTGASLIPDEVWETMPNLEKLWLSSTNLSSLPNVGALKELTHLLLKKNNIENISNFDNLKGLAKLKELNLRQNKLTTVPNLLELANEISSEFLKVDLRENNFGCDVSMKWIKSMSVR